MSKVKVFSGERGNGKTRRLMEYARDNNCIILTTNKSSLGYKAQRYGINVSIWDYIDVIANEGKEINQNVVVDDCVSFMEAILGHYDIKAVSVTDDYLGEKHETN